MIPILVVNVRLPRYPNVGQIFFIKRGPGAGGPIIQGNGNSMFSGSAIDQDLIKDTGQCAIVFWDGIYWEYQKIKW